MKTFNRFCWLCLFVGIIIVLMLSFSGCASKKKLIQRTQFSTEIATVERVKEKSETESKTDISTSETSKETTTSNNENFEGEIADHTKPATITTEEKDGKKIKTYINFKNIKIGEQNSESETNKTFGQKMSKIDKSKTAKQSESELDLKASGSNKDIDIEKDGKFPWPWIVILLLLYAVVSYLRKSLNPLKWI